MKPKSSNSFRSHFSTLAAITIACAGSARAADFTWGGGNLDWTDTTGAGWSGGPPGAGDNATINSGTVTVSTNVPGYLNNVTLNGTAVLDITTGKLNPGGYTFVPTFTLNSGTTLRVAGWDYDQAGSIGALDFQRPRLVVNGATIEFTGNSNSTANGDAGRNFTVGTGGATLKTITAGQTWTIAKHTDSINFNIENSTGLTLGGVGNGVIAKFINGAGALTKADSGTWALTAANTNSGNVTVSGGKLAVTGTGKLYSNLGWQNRVVTVNGGGILEVDRWNGGEALGELNYSAGNVVMNNGTIRYTGNTNSISVNNGQGFTIGAGGATLESATAGQTWNITLDTRSDYGIASDASGTLNLTGAGNGMISKVIGGGGGLTKGGSGTWTLSASNTYTGATVVKAGTLKLDTSTTLSTSSSLVAGDTGSSGAVLDVAAGGLTVGSAQTLAGIGTVLATGQTVTVNGKLSAGDGGTGTLAISGGSLTMGATSIFDWDINTVANTSDSVSVGSTLTVTSGAIFNIISNTAFTDTFWDTTRSWDVFGGKDFDGFNLNFLANNVSQVAGDFAAEGAFTFTAGGTNLTWTAVPEPTSALAGLLIGAGLLRRRRTP